MCKTNILHPQAANLTNLMWTPSPKTSQVRQNCRAKRRACHWRSAFNGKRLSAVCRRLTRCKTAFIGCGHLADKPLVQKRHVDSFLNTNLLEILQENGTQKVDICGIMTQNCVTHTALSPLAKDYKIRVLSSLCTAPTELIHQIALGALADRAWIEVV